MGDAVTFHFNEIYSKEVADAIKHEFSRTQDQYYLEHAGATLYSEKQIQNVAANLCKNLYANPHAGSSSNKVTQDAVDIVRYEVLAHFNTNPDEYSLIFTSGATAALRLIAQTFQYGSPIQGKLVYLQDNHTSVLGMRPEAPSVQCLGIEEAFEIFRSNPDEEKNTHVTIRNRNNDSSDVRNNNSNLREILENDCVSHRLSTTDGTLLDGREEFSSHRSGHSEGTVDAGEIISSPRLITDVTDSSGGENFLFVYPAQSNFSGTKYPLEWIEKVHKGALSHTALADRKSQFSGKFDVNEHSENHSNVLGEDRHGAPNQKTSDADDESRSSYKNTNCDDVVCTDETEKSWFVALDAAAYVSTSPLDLSRFKPDFVVMSFYKMFGYPTGVGALLVKNSSAHVLDKKYYGGGTVLMALSLDNVAVPKPLLHERFEDGTLPFLSIISIKEGFDTLKRLNLNYDLVSRHTFSLARYVYRNLVRLHHRNGRPAVVPYHLTSFEDSAHQGGIVTFNLLREDGDFVGYSEVMHLLNLFGFHLRTGCCCNPGACQYFLGLSSDEVRRHFEAGHVCGDQYDLIQGVPTGAVRISFGYMSTIEDAQKFLEVIKNCFVTQPCIEQLPSEWQSWQEKYDRLFNRPKKSGEIYRNSENDNSNINVGNNMMMEIQGERQKIEVLTDDSRVFKNDEHNIERENLSSDVVPGILQKSIENCLFIDNDENCIERSARGVLRRILLYPVKSCGEFAVSTKWPLTSTGLKYDREWMIVNQVGVCVTQKQNRKLCLIKPVVDLRRNLLTLTCRGHDSVSLPMDSISLNTVNGYFCQSKVCGDSILGYDCGDEVAEWLETVLESKTGLRLLRQCTNEEEVVQRTHKDDDLLQLSLANKAQFLLINLTSVRWLTDKIPGEFTEDIATSTQRFRPNFVVEFDQPFVEDRYEEFFFNKTKFKSSGKCTRCQMICIDQRTGKISKEPLQTLAREFKGRISFGIYLNRSDSSQNCYISVGDTVVGQKVVKN